MGFSPKVIGTMKPLYCNKVIFKNMINFKTFSNYTGFLTSALTLSAQGLCVCVVVYHVPVLQSSNSASLILSAYLGSLSVSIYLFAYLSICHQVFVSTVYTFKHMRFPPCRYQCPSHESPKTHTE